MMQDTAGRRFVRAAMRAPYLKRDEERDLAERWRDKHDQQALNRITLSHMRLVIAMATKFRHFGLPVSDLVQEGHVGLLEAAARSDGQALGSGYGFPVTVASAARWAQGLEERGIQLAPASALAQRPGRGT